MSLLVSLRGIIFKHVILQVLGLVKPGALWFCLINKAWKVFVYCVFINFLYPFCADSWCLIMWVYCCFSIKIPTRKRPCFLMGMSHVCKGKKNPTAKSLFQVNCLKKTPTKPKNKTKKPQGCLAGVFALHSCPLKSKLWNHLGQFRPWGTCLKTDEVNTELLDLWIFFPLPKPHTFLRQYILLFLYKFLSNTSGI